ncbi:hypothetical protein [Radiobacillus deserti]|uniref:hypothetical protein n=1 Tax=Radiobacillus deserti TaxID=2594883 RepID=UPI0013151208|nr:hypothetical protein [Radiobacillus deserti]
MNTSNEYRALMNQMLQAQKVHQNRLITEDEVTESARLLQEAIDQLRGTTS